MPYILIICATACFSPRVPPTVQREWVQNGGQIASVKHEDAHATHVFCDGSDDPWFCRLVQHSTNSQIFHWSWISAVVRAQFRLPISSYLIDVTTQKVSSRKATARRCPMSLMPSRLRDDPSSMIHSLPTSGMSVSEALEALKSVSVDGVVQFLPGTVHMGKEFRCSYAREFLRG
ncbi:hypothetical protein L226DRAFT_468862 [Lentinus tigrinus ALCF2SS1-7]|uniref:uncharacterized protein n=1 Tax=Lentinus tigrinus ALCF2SS1-7 TaxID=1328758 RepID=UPI0011660BC3|nr:hypothetical protein L226DRAFT_468862 [Lentinus tigrinus ALCF2SS1-7]